MYSFVLYKMDHLLLLIFVADFSEVTSDLVESPEQNFHRLDVSRVNSLSAL